MTTTAAPDLATLATQITAAWGKYLNATKKGIQDAYAAGKLLKAAKTQAQDEGRVWAKWVDAQKATDPTFPSRQWADKLITLADGWDKVKTRADLGSVEEAVRIIKGRVRGGKRVSKIKRAKLAEAIQTTGATIDADTLGRLLEAVGIKVEFVD